MRIWILNPFDQLPNETDVPLRYWSLCKAFASQGHEVTWWSSDFSHLTKSKRAPCPDTDGFAVRLIETPPYSQNISFARLKNHKAFADGFYRDALAALQSGKLEAPDRIVVSLPPLGIAEQAFKIRDFIQQSSPIHHPATTAACEVVVDIMDAWPETFYQALPKPLRKLLGPLLLAPLHRSARRAYQGADKITAVGQSYLDLAATYLGYPPSATNPLAAGEAQSSQATPAKPMLLCYHGTDLERFQRFKTKHQEEGRAAASRSAVTTQSSSPNKPLKAVYLGAMGQGYDLMTILKVAARWKAEGQFPIQIHFAGTGSQIAQLKAYAAQEGLLSEAGDQSTEDNHPPSVISHQSSLTKSAPSAISHQSSVINDSSRIVFHGLLNKDAVNELLLSSDLALVPNRPDSLVACPYKAGEYAAAGLPMLSCLSGELNQLLSEWNAGSKYTEGDAASLQAAFENYVSDPARLNRQSLNARNMAEALFDRNQTYAALANFIIP